VFLTTLIWNEVYLNIWQHYARHTFIRVYRMMFSSTDRLTTTKQNNVTLWTTKRCPGTDTDQKKTQKQMSTRRPRRSTSLVVLPHLCLQQCSLISSDSEWHLSEPGDKPLEQCVIQLVDVMLLFNDRCIASSVN